MSVQNMYLNIMNERMQSEMDKQWDSGSWSEEKLEAMKTEHLRTSYQFQRIDISSLMKHATKSM